jgi:hypothetical protein
MKWLRPMRPSPALVVASVALIVAMAGTSYAASQIGSNQIKNGAVTNAKIKNGAVGNHKIANGAVGNHKIANGAVGNAKIANGAINGAKLNLSALGTVPSATTATNAGHATTADTATTANALGGVRYVSSGPLANPANSQTFGQVLCPAGLFVSGGGVFGSGGVGQSVNSSYPRSSTGVAGSIPNAWGAYVNNNTAAPLTFTVYAICIPESGASSSFARHANAK